MGTYLALDTVEEREYAIAHARWLREHANELRHREPEKAAEFDADARDLEQSLRNRLEQEQSADDKKSP